MHNKSNSIHSLTWPNHRFHPVSLDFQVLGEFDGLAFLEKKQEEQIMYTKHIN